MAAVITQSMIHDFVCIFTTIQLHRFLFVYTDFGFFMNGYVFCSDYLPAFAMGLNIA